MQKPKTFLHQFFCSYRPYFCFWTLVYYCVCVLYFHNYLIRTWPNQRLQGNKTWSQRPLPPRLPQQQLMNLRPNIGADWDSNLFHFSNKNLLLQALNRVRFSIMNPNSIEIFLQGVIILICFSVTKRLQLQFKDLFYVISQVTF